VCGKRNENGLCYGKGDNDFGTYASGGMLTPNDWDIEMGGVQVDI